MDAMQNASRAFQVLGGIFQKDLSVYTDETSHKQPIVTLYRSLYVRQKNITCAVNIDENQLYKLYSGLNSGKAREIRLLTLDGIIISSSNKEEIGTQYNQIPPDYLANDGKATVEGKKKIQVVWKKINDLGIVVVVDTPLKGYTDILSMNQIRIASIFLVGILITCTMFFFWLNRILHPLDKLIYGMHLVGNGDYTQRLPHKGTDEFSILTRQYNHMLDDLISFQERQHTTELEIRESELRALRNQINPHFLYNTLNAVKWMARFSGAENIDKCISALGAIIVPLYKDNSPRCTLQKELELLNNYLIIMNIRYNNKITFRQQIPPHLLDTEIPRFILQPLVENSIQYSYAGSSTNAIITLIASCSKETLTLLLSDNGRGMTKQAINEYNDIFIRNRPSSGVGMVNVNRRIRLQYGDAYGIRLQPNTPCGLNVILELPLTYTENK
jgi:two-component system sensor histidine kinase YesM